MKIILADDNDTFRDALSLFLEYELNHQVLAECKNGLELLCHDELHKAHVVILDIEMPVLNGFETMTEINKQYSWMKVIAITQYYEHAYIVELIKRGFSGFVLKNTLFDEIENVLIEVSNGKISFPDSII